MKKKDFGRDKNIVTTETAGIWGSYYLVILSYPAMPTQHYLLLLYII